jgi:hypothetical protein
VDATAICKAGGFCCKNGAVRCGLLIKIVNILYVSAKAHDAFSDPVARKVGAPYGLNRPKPTRGHINVEFLTMFCRDRFPCPTLKIGSQALLSLCFAYRRSSHLRSRRSRPAWCCATVKPEWPGGAVPLSGAKHYRPGRASLSSMDLIIIRNYIYIESNKVKALEVYVGEH